jgi:Leucine-rich repeat (LRR) protein
LSFNLLKRMDYLDHCQDLRDLKLHGNHLTTVGSLEKCINLESIVLSDNQLTIDALKAARLDTLPKLTHLHVVRNQLRCV